MALIGIVAAIVFLLDQGTKIWIRAAFVPGESTPLISDFLHLTYVRNTGAAFGILEGRVELVIAITAVMVAAVVWYARKVARGGSWIRLGYGLALGGAIGNLVDRLRFGWVTDFVDFLIWPPVFNAADTAIFFGVCILLWHTVFIASEPSVNEESSKT